MIEKNAAGRNQTGPQFSENSLAGSVNHIFNGNPRWTFAPRLPCPLPRTCARALLALSCGTTEPRSLRPMRFLFLLLFPAALSAQASCGGDTPFQILHFTRTAGFDHNTRAQSAGMFTDLGALDGYTVVNTDALTAFDDLATLLTYEVIVFSNTSGNIPFTATQRANLENYIAAGGAFLGIHAATDMYRNGSYPFYTRLVGGSRRNSPAHTANNYAGTLDVIGSHPSTAGLPTPWAKAEEYYYWPDTGLVAGITEVLRVRSTGSNAYDAPRPISWYQAFDSGARSFYTALGHARSNYTDAGNDFRLHLRQALCWCVEAEPANLPLLLSSIRLTAENGRHRIDWTVSGDLPTRVELHGGTNRDALRVLSSATPQSFNGSFDHRPTDPTSRFYYRLRLFDADGLPVWSGWLAGQPQPGARPQVRYEDGTPMLLVPTGGPTAAWVTDAAGRRIASLRLGEGLFRLPAPGPGVYFVRFPFGGGVRYVVRG